MAAKKAKKGIKGPKAPASAGFKAGLRGVSSTKKGKK